MDSISSLVRGHIAIITINRPEALNALNSRMLEKLNDALRQAKEDTEIRCVILTGGGEKAFTAGGDVKEEAALNGEEARRFSQDGKQCILSILRHRVPVISMVRGYALGGGMELILASDLTVAADDAKIGIPTIRLGSIPGWAGTVLLPRIVGASRAKELLYTGRTLSAAEAQALGIVEFVTPPDQLMAVTLKLAQEIADMPPIAMESMKKSINHSIETGLEGCLETETELFSACFKTEDHQEAAAAFLEKRAHGEYRRR